jgi:hypothetical protein
VSRIILFFDNFLKDFLLFLIKIINAILEMAFMIINNYSAGAEIASTGQTETQAPQSVQRAGSILY